MVRNRKKSNSKLLVVVVALGIFGTILLVGIPGQVDPLVEQLGFYAIAEQFNPLDITGANIVLKDFVKPTGGTSQFNYFCNVKTTIELESVTGSLKRINSQFDTFSPLFSVTERQIGDLKNIDTLVRFNCADLISVDNERIPIFIEPSQLTLKHFETDQNGNRILVKQTTVTTQQVRLADTPDQVNFDGFPIFTGTERLLYRFTTTAQEMEDKISFTDQNGYNAQQEIELTGTLNIHIPLFDNIIPNEQFILKHKINEGVVKNSFSVRITKGQPGITFQDTGNNISIFKLSPKIIDVGVNAPSDVRNTLMEVQAVLDRWSSTEGNPVLTVINPSNQIDRTIAMSFQGGGNGADATFKANFRFDPSDQIGSWTINIKSNTDQTGKLARSTIAAGKFEVINTKPVVQLSCTAPEELNEEKTLCIDPGTGLPPVGGTPQPAGTCIAPLVKTTDGQCIVDPAQISNLCNSLFGGQTANFGVDAQFVCPDGAIAGISTTLLLLGGGGLVLFIIIIAASSGGGRAATTIISLARPGKKA